MTPNLPTYWDLTDKLKMNYWKLCKIKSDCDRKRAAEAALKKQPVKRKRRSHHD